MKPDQSISRWEEMKAGPGRRRRRRRGWRKAREYKSLVVMLEH
jgi:hypothetical protein